MNINDFQTTNINLTKRTLLKQVRISSLIILGWGILPSIARASLLRTPRQAEGPFYPVKKPIDQDADLTFVSTRKKRAQGEICIIRGRVFDVNGRPLSGVLLEIWQANKWGRYQDKRDKSDLPVDINFQGFGVARTDKNGRYIFKTIRPGGYSFGGIERTPHIHFRINAVGVNEFISQMYFAGELKNKRDYFLNNILQKERVVVAFRPMANGSKVGIFNIVLAYLGKRPDKECLLSC